MKIDIKYSRLLKIYGKLLTPLQHEITEMYYHFDLSLTEIAEIKNVTRQSVEYTLKTVRRVLDGFEESLGIMGLLDRLDSFSDTLSEEKKKELIEILEK